jgi:uncharacterized protein (TIGR03083 family)
MAALRYDRYLDALTAQSELLAAVLAGADTQQRVVTCPGWTLRQLVEHVGQGHRGVTTLITKRASAPPPAGQLPPPAPEQPQALSVWLREGAAQLVDALREAGPHTTIWSWTDDHSTGFWARRMAHETAVHRADAELTLHRAFTLDADLAADAISEWLGLLSLPQAVEYRPELAALRGDGQILHVHSTDPGLGEAGEWIVRRTPSGPVWEHGHARGDVAVRGTAVDLLLVLMRRVAPAQAPITVHGDASLLDHWLEHTRF